MNDKSSPIKLTSAANEVEAAIIASALKEYGVQATTTGEYVSGFKAEAPGDVAVFVPALQLIKARQALADMRRDMSNIDWSQVDVGTPE